MSAMKKIGKFFVTGTDTDSGKTLITEALLKKASDQGFKTLGLKPIAAGATVIDGELKNSDAIKLQSVSTVKLSYSQVNPVVFEEAVAPHIAANRENKLVTVSKLEGFVRGAMMTPSDFCLIEGAGGWLVPLNDREPLSLLPKRLDLPVILVVGLKLGCLNHALLTAQAIRSSGLQLVGWVANQVDAEMDRVDENISSLRNMLGAPCLGVVPFIDAVDAEKVSQFIELPQ